MRMSFISSAFPSAGRSRSARRAGVRQQGHLPRVLDGLGDLALLLHGNAGDPTGSDLAAVRDELPQDVDVLVVDLLDSRALERVLLLLGLANGWLRHRGAPPQEPEHSPGWSVISGSIRLMGSEGRVLAGARVGVAAARGAGGP